MSGSPHPIGRRQGTEPAPAPDDAFGHVIGDGFVIVHYQPQLPGDQLAQLLGASDAGQPEQLKAVNAYTTLVCDSFDLDALRQFTRGWFDDPRSESA